MMAAARLMPIDKSLVEEKYYRWWLEICKLLNPGKRQNLRCAISIIEAYRSEMLYTHLRKVYRHAATQQGFDAQQWEKKYIHALEKYMEKDKKHIHRMAVQCPNMLICIAGVINGIRRSSNIKSAIKTILLLDVIDISNIDLIADLEMSQVRCLQKSSSVYLPLKEPEIHSIVSIVENMFKVQPNLHKLIEEKYAAKRHLIAQTLGIRLDNE